MNEYLSIEQQIAQRTESVDSPLVGEDPIAKECASRITALLAEQNGLACTILLRGNLFEFYTVSDVSEFAGALGISVEEIDASLHTVQPKN